MLKSFDYFEKNYTKGGLIGKGTYSRVFEVVNNQDKKKYALKEIEIETGEELNNYNIRQRVTASWEFIASKFPEIISALIEIHPCIAEIFFFFVRNESEVDVLCIVMEFFPLSLEQELHKYRMQNKKYSPRQFLKVFQSLVSGLSYLQTKYQVAHRDLKPANIMVTHGNNYKLIDFGISTTIMDGDQSKLRTLVGTPKYMAPELLESFLTEKSRTNYCPYKSDCFSLGLMMLELCCDSNEEISGINRLFENGESKLQAMLEKAESHYGPLLKNLIAQMLERVPDKRPSYKQTYEQLNLIKDNLKTNEKFWEPKTSVNASSIGNELGESLSSSFIAASLEPTENKETPIQISNDHRLAFLLGAIYFILIAQVSNYRSYLHAYSYAQNESMVYLHESLNFIRASARTIATFLIPLSMLFFLKKIGSMRTLALILLINALLNFISIFVKEFNSLVCFRVISDRLVITSPMVFFILVLEKSGVKIALIFCTIFCAENLHNLFKYIPQIYIDLYSKDTISNDFWKFSIFNIILNTIGIGLLIPLKRLKSSKINSFKKNNTFLSVYEEYLGTYLSNLFDMIKSSVFWFFVLLFSVITTSAYSIEILLFDENLYSTERLLSNIFYQTLVLIISILTVIFTAEARRTFWLFLSAGIAFTTSITINLSGSLYPIILAAIPRGVCCSLLPRLLIDRLISRNIIYGALFSIFLTMNIIRTIIELGNFQYYEKEYNRYLFVALGYVFSVSGFLLCFILRKMKLNLA